MSKYLSVTSWSFGLILAPLIALGLIELLFKSLCHSPLIAGAEVHGLCLINDIAGESTGALLLVYYILLAVTFSMLRSWRYVIVSAIVILLILILRPHTRVYWLGQDVTSAST